VVYGDVVTLAYTKPATNPIQTVAGGQAISLSAQKVTNNTINLVKQAPLTIKMTVYPNPVHHTVNIQWVYLASLSGQDATMLVSKIRILDLSGKLYVEKLIQAGATSLRIAIDLRPGIYVVVALSSGGTQMFSQKIIVY
jgi:poly-beta-hydroxyalkanoate depolymerase